MTANTTPRTDAREERELLRECAALLSDTAESLRADYNILDGNLRVMARRIELALSKGQTNVAPQAAAVIPGELGQPGKQILVGATPKGNWNPNETPEELAARLKKIKEFQDEIAKEAKGQTKAVLDPSVYDEADQHRTVPEQKEQTKAVPQDSTTTETPEGPRSNNPSPAGTAPGRGEPDPFNCPKCGAHDYGLFAAAMVGCPHCLAAELDRVRGELETEKRLHEDQVMRQRQEMIACLQRAATAEASVAQMREGLKEAYAAIRDVAPFMSAELDTKWNEKHAAPIARSQHE